VLSDECYVYLNYTGEQFSVGSLPDFPRTNADRRLTIEDLCHDGLASGLCAGTGSGDRGHGRSCKANPLRIRHPSCKRRQWRLLNGPRSSAWRICVSNTSSWRDHVVNGLRSNSPTCNALCPRARFYAYPNISSFIGRGGIQSASDVAGRLLARGACGDGPRGRFRYSRTIFGSLTPRRQPNWIVGWSACASSLRPCRAAAVQKILGRVAWVVVPRAYRVSALYPFSMQPAFDPRPLGHAGSVADLSEPQVRGEDRRSLADRRRRQSGERSLERTVTCRSEC